MGVDQCLDFGGRRPDLGQEDRLTVRVAAEGFGLQIDIDPAGNGKGHDQQRRTEKIALDPLMDPRLEIAVAGEHRRHVHLVYFNQALDRRMQGSAVADAGRAAEGGKMEAEGLKIRGEAGGIQVTDHDLRPRGKGCLDEGGDLQSPSHRVSRQETGTDEDEGIGGVGAGGDGGDDDTAVTDPYRGAVDLAGEFPAVDRQAFAVPGFMAARLLLEGRNLRDLDVPLVPAAEDSGKGRFHRRERDPVLRSGRTGETGGDRREVDVEDVGVLPLVVGSQVKKTVGSGVGLGYIGLEIAIREPEIVDGPVVDREIAEGGANSGVMLAIVADREP